MNDRTILFLTLGVSLAGLYVSYRTAMALQDAKAQVDKITASPVGQTIDNLGKALGW